MWDALIILGEEYWEIELPLFGYNSHAEADAAANSDVNPTFVIVEGAPAIRISLNGNIRHFFDNDVTISEVKPEKIAQMGPPLDMRDPMARKIAIQSLMLQAPTYTIEPDDMEPSDKTLHDFLTRYGDGYRIDAIAYAVFES